MTKFNSIKIIFFVLLLFITVLLFFYLKNNPRDYGREYILNHLGELVTTETVDTTDTIVTTTTSTDISGTGQSIIESNLVDSKIIIDDTLCSQISKEYVANITGLSIARIESINDVSITACDYYLTNERNSPYIAIILNKNLNVELQKNFSLKQKLTLSTDSRIITDHFIVKSPKDDKIVHINLIIDPNNFIRIDKNVDRAISDEGLLKLAIGLSKRL